MVEDTELPISSVTDVVHELRYFSRVVRWTR